MQVPLYGFLAGDTLGIVILVHDHETIDDVARSLQQAAAMRVAPMPRVRVLVRGTQLDLRATVAESGLRAFDRIDVVAEDR